MLWMAALTTFVASGIAMGFPVPFFIVGRRRLLPLRWLSCKPLRTCRGLHAPTDVPENSSLFHPGIRLPKPSAALRAALGTAEDSLGWARGAHEQCANSALFALSQPSCLVCCLPGPGLMKPCPGMLV